MTKKQDKTPELKPYLRGNMYYVSFYIDDKQLQRSTKQTEYHKACQEAPNIYKAEVAKAATQLSGQKITLKDACDNWLADIKPGLSEDTYVMYRTFTRRMQGYRTRVGNHQKLAPVPALMQPDCLLHSLTQDHVDNFVDTLNSFYGPDAFKQHFKRLRKFLKWCRSKNRYSKKVSYACPVIDMSDEYYEKNGRSIFRPSATRDRVFTDEQVDQMLAIAKDSRNKDNYTLLCIFADVSIRHHEACRLEWKHVNWSDNTLYVKRMKGSPSAAVPMTNRLRTALEMQHARTGQGTYIFPSELSNTGYKSHKNLTWFHLILKQLPDNPNSPENIKKYGSRLVPHSFRHTIGALAAEHMKPAQVQKVTGHSTIRMSQHYSKLRTDTAVETMATIKNRIEAGKRDEMLTIGGEAANDPVMVNTG